VAFQVVEFELDAQGNVLERRVVPYPYQGRQEAAAGKEHRWLLRRGALRPNEFFGALLAIKVVRAPRR